MAKGLPGSGKSTWALDTVACAQGATKRVNKDDLRRMIDAGGWSKDNEKMILKIRDLIISTALLGGNNVIVDDTNLDPTHESTLRELARSHSADFVIKDFTHVSVETCISNDLKRLHSVGESVIRSMYDRYLKPPPPVIATIPGAPYCFIVDLDGTTAINDGHRGWYEEAKVLNDKPNDPVVSSIKAIVFGDIHDVGTVIYVSGRSELCHTDTIQWLMVHGLPAGDLHMRTAGDTRDDTIVKREIYEREIKGKYNVVAVWDDRNKVVEMWRSLGLTCFQVAPGKF